MRLRREREREELADERAEGHPERGKWTFEPLWEVKRMMGGCSRTGSRFGRSSKAWAKGEGRGEVD